jgi:sortase system peptidoglycan-associated protein
MYKQIIFVLLLSLSAGTALADNQRANYQHTSSADEATGLFSGLAIGGLAGGPPGAIVGAAIGALLGDRFYIRKHAAVLQVQLDESQLQLTALRNETLAAQKDRQLAQAELEKLRSNAARIIPARLDIASASPCCDNTVLSLHFRSGSSAIEPHYEEELSSLVKLARQMPAANVEITGYADRNGDAEMNLNLSRARSATIKRYFNRMGIQNSSITTVAYGETQPLAAIQSFEADFFDRRVIVRLRDSSQQMLSQLPDGE